MSLRLNRCISLQYAPAIQPRELYSYLSLRGKFRELHR